MGARTLCFNNRENGLEKVLGIDSSPNTIDELLSTDVILMLGYKFEMNPIIQLKVKQAAENGAKVVLVNPVDYEQERFEFATKTVYTENDLNFLKSIAKALIDGGKESSEDGFDAFKDSLKDVVVSEDTKESAALYAGAKKAMIVFQQNLVTTDAATLIGDIALLSGHIGGARDGVLQLKAKNNSQGLIDMGIYHGAEAMDGVKALLVFGEDPKNVDLSGLEFLMVSDTHATETVAKADVVLPGTGFASVDGTYTNTERRLMPVEAAIDEGIDLANWEIAAEIAYAYEVEFGWEDTADISAEMDDTEPLYKYAEIGEILDDVLVPEFAEFVVVGDGAFVEPLPCTDNLMNMISQRLPKPVCMTE